MGEPLLAFCPYRQTMADRESASGLTIGNVVERAARQRRMPRAGSEM
jgi:hypothetical protein